MTPLEAHRARILAALTRLSVETVPLAAARGRVLAESVYTRWPIPLFDNSAMDGFAVRHEDATAGAVLRVVADIPAGSAADPTLGPGEAARIMTGAPVPADATAIVPLEHTDVGTTVSPEPPSHVTIATASALGAHIRKAGEDAAAGDEAVAAGAVLGAWHLSAIASAGHDSVAVVRAPRVVVVSTGSELVAPGATPARGQIPESNSVLLAAAIAEAGAEVLRVLTVSDDPAAFRGAVLEATATADAVVCSGGASVGSFDVVKAVLGGEFGVTFDKIAMQPGKPQGFGAVDGTACFCLPGNPVSVAVSFEMFVRPALLSMAGHSMLERPQVRKAASVGWRSPEGRTQVVPAVIEGDTVRPATAGGSGSHLVSSLAAASALAVVPASVTEVVPGDELTVIVLS